MKRTFFFLFWFSFCRGYCLDQIPLENLDRLITYCVKAFDIPGLSVGCVLEDTSFTRHYGVQNLSTQVPINDESLFRIGSLSKSFTAAIFENLSQDRELDLDKPITHYIPKFRLKDEWVQQQITLRDLLTHSSGLNMSYLSCLALGGARKERFLEAIKDLKEEPFRETFKYSNFSYIFLAYILEQVSKKPWEEFIQEKMIDRLGLKSTYPSYQLCNVKERIVSSYIKINKKHHLSPLNPYLESTGSCSNVVLSAGGIFSTTSDMNLYMKYLLKHQNSDLKDLFKMHISTTDDKNIGIKKLGYGEGFYIGEYEGVTCFFHPGSFEAFSSFMMLVPSLHFGVVLLANCEAADFLLEYLAPAIFNLIYHNKSDTLAIEKQKLVLTYFEQGLSNLFQEIEKESMTLSEEEASKLSGFYQNEDIGEISIFFDKLLEFRWFGILYTCYQKSKDEFYCVGKSAFFPRSLKLFFLRTITGEVFAVYVHSEFAEMSTLFLKKEPLISFNKYEHTFLNSSIKVKLCEEEQQLYLLASEKKIKLNYLGNNLFSTPSLDFYIKVLFDGEEVEGVDYYSDNFFYKLKKAL